ncbi:hypothetical protein [Staphylococcus sp. 17KM0847]|uniref:hypothetical protein n=1 Tax=Staphylococcus sp. 17KM0847 TaxID=2583989 RepID=UPI0015DCA280|nr:hypothetical protein [Staphylococcus sp. 17KM0847]QLK85674.1 hypothetical protein FGL66_02590 [Staphylococcus sp. 17KM0847]
MRVRIEGDTYLHDLEVSGHRYSLYSLVDEKKWAIDDDIDFIKEMVIAKSKTPEPIIESNKVDELFNFEHHGADSQKLTPYINENKYHFVKLEDGFQKFIQLNQDLFDEREKIVERMKNE